MRAISAGRIEKLPLIPRRLMFAVWHVFGRTHRQAVSRLSWLSFSRPGLCHRVPEPGHGPVARVATCKLPTPAMLNEPDGTFTRVVRTKRTAVRTPLVGLRRLAASSPTSIGHSPADRRETSAASARYFSVAPLQNFKACPSDRTRRLARVRLVAPRSFNSASLRRAGQACLQASGSTSERLCGW